jgi:glycerol-3-phosphate acyltransferase PlsY
MDESPMFASAKGIATLIRRGSGVLGKSAIVMGVLVLGICIAPFRLHSDDAIIKVFILAGILFFLWFFPIIVFAYKKPAEILLDSASWLEHQQFLSAIASKEHPLGLGDKDQQTITVGAKEPSSESESKGQKS